MVSGNWQSLVDSLKDFSHQSFNSEPERVQVEQALRQVLRRVQRPFDTALDHCWADPITASFIKQLVDVGLFEAWVKQGGGPSDVKKLASISDVEAPLLKRLLRVLVAQGLVLQNGDQYELTDFSKELANPSFAAIYTYYFDCQQPLFAHWPTFAAKTGNKNPVDPTKTNFLDWQKGDFFSYVTRNSEITDAFGKVMTVVAASKTPWAEIYPTENLVADAQPGRIVLVDVAGGVGHDLEQFRVKYPNLAEQLVLQDLPKVVESAIPPAPVQKQGINILEGPNPVQGARAYYLKTVLHDWPDDKAVLILQNIAKSMQRGYSRIFIHETVISTNNMNPRTVSSDATMMMTFSASEREESTWRQIVKEAGLQVVNIWAPTAPDSIIELDLA